MSRRSLTRAGSAAGALCTVASNKSPWASAHDEPVGLWVSGRQGRALPSGPGDVEAAAPALAVPSGPIPSPPVLVAVRAGSP